MIWASHSLSSLGRRQWQTTAKMLPRKLHGLVLAVARSGTKNGGRRRHRGKKKALYLALNFPHRSGVPNLWGLVARLEGRERGTGQLASGLSPWVNGGLAHLRSSSTSGWYSIHMHDCRWLTTCAKWAMHAHWPVTHSVQFQIGHSPAIGHGPEVGKLCHRWWNVGIKMNLS